MGKIIRLYGTWDKETHILQQYPDVNTGSASGGLAVNGGSAGNKTYAILGVTLPEKIYENSTLTRYNGMELPKESNITKARLYIKTHPTASKSANVVCYELKQDFVEGTSGDVELASGTDDGVGARATQMDDSGGDFINDGVTVGDWIENETDNSWGRITARTAVQISFTALVGGTNNDFENGDSYTIYNMSAGATWNDYNYITADNTHQEWVTSGGGCYAAPGTDADVDNDSDYGFGENGIISTTYIDSDATWESIWFSRLFHTKNKKWGDSIFLFLKPLDETKDDSALVFYSTEADGGSNPPEFHVYIEIDEPEDVYDFKVVPYYLNHESLPRFKMTAPKTGETCFILRHTSNEIDITNPDRYGHITTWDDADPFVITDSNKAWTVDEFNTDYSVLILTGTCAGEYKDITDTTSTTITIASDFTGNPEAGVEGVGADYIILPTSYIVTTNKGVVFSEINMNDDNIVYETTNQAENTDYYYAAYVQDKVNTGIYATKSNEASLKRPTLHHADGYTEIEKYASSAWVNSANSVEAHQLMRVVAHTNDSSCKFKRMYANFDFGVQKYTGTHTDTSDNANLLDSGGVDFTTAPIVTEGDWVFNTTEEAHAKCTTVAAAELTVALSGGASENLWDVGDTYYVIDFDEGRFTEDMDKWVDLDEENWTSNIEFRYPEVESNPVIIVVQVEDKYGWRSNLHLVTTGILSSGVTNLSPRAILDVSPERGETNETITFNASRSYDRNADGTISNYYFFDGKVHSWTDNSTNPIYTTTYTSNNFFLVRCSVKDNNGVYYPTQPPTYGTGNCFDVVYHHHDDSSATSSMNDERNAARTLATDFTDAFDSGDIIYIGRVATIDNFDEIHTFIEDAATSDPEATYHYWDGSWTQITAADHNLVDNTIDTSANGWEFERSGNTKWDKQNDATAATFSSVVSDATAFTITYNKGVGGGTKCELTISEALDTLTTDTNGGNDLNIDLSNAATDTITEVITAINAVGGYTATDTQHYTTDTATPTTTSGLAAASAVDIDGVVADVEMQFHTDSCYWIKITSTNTTSCKFEGIYPTDNDFSQVIEIVQDIETGATDLVTLIGIKPTDVVVNEEYPVDVQKPLGSTDWEDVSFGRMPPTLSITWTLAFGGSEGDTALTAIRNAIRNHTQVVYQGIKDDGSADEKYYGWLTSITKNQRAANSRVVTAEMHVVSVV